MTECEGSSQIWWDVCILGRQNMPFQRCHILKSPDLFAILPQMVNWFPRTAINNPHKHPGALDNRNVFSQSIWKPGQNQGVGKVHSLWRLSGRFHFHNLHSVSLCLLFCHLPHTLIGFRDPSHSQSSHLGIFKLHL